MKKKSNKDLILFVLIISVFMILAFYISSKMENITPPYSVENKNKMGYSVFYESLRQLNYPVEKTVTRLGNHQINNIQIIPPGGEFNINDPKVKKWVENGGMLVYLTKETGNKIQYGTQVESKGDIKFYSYHNGIIINANSDSLINKTLINDTSKAYVLLQQIGNLQYKKIYFNESYLLQSASTKTLWDTVPIQIKYIIYQIIIALCAFFYYKGKRFGKIIPLYEETERNENEYLYSAASLYRAARCWDLMASIYYNSFLKGFNHNEEDWIEYWEIEKIPSLQRARDVYDFMKYKNTKGNAKKHIEIINSIEHLNTIMAKRRDLQWKTLKETLHGKS